MACLNINIIPVEPGTLTVVPARPAGLAAEPALPAELSAEPVGGTALEVTPSAGARLEVTPSVPLSLSVGEVCTVSGGTIVVLAASDGPLRTRGGGYLLLNPATNPPEN